jgi:P4 family phage/plasmid primase-like protien
MDVISELEKEVSSTVVLPTLEVLADLRNLLGNGTVLIPVQWGNKKPAIKNWPKLTMSDMGNPAHMQRLLLGNVGVLLGKASGGLVSIDCDTDESLKELLGANSWMAETLQTRGQRGGNVWIRLASGYPPAGKFFSAADPKKTFGEWRADGGQTIVFGLHPAGFAYKIINNRPPILVEFIRIKWPSGWILPWQKSPIEELIEQHGAPFHTDGPVKLNEMFFTAKFAQEHPVIFSRTDGAFFRYQPESGFWRKCSEPELEQDFLKEIGAIAAQVDNKQFLRQQTIWRAKALVANLRGRVEANDFFSKRPPCVHVANCMLSIANGAWEQLSFSPSYRSRNRSHITFDPSAQCDRFLNQLLHPVLSPDDQRLIQILFGQALLGKNYAQKIFILTGPGGVGKSTLVEVLVRLIGDDNIAHLRTDHLLGRFELAAYSGKTLLLGADVPRNFLNCAGAGVLKALVGGDRLDGEVKGAAERYSIRGDYSVVVTSNGRLKVALESDQSAWERRLVLIPFDRVVPDRPVLNFAELLIREEGSGILNFALEGAKIVLREMERDGRVMLTDCQRGRVQDLLNESDSAAYFVRAQIVRRDGASLTSAEAYEAYEGFCDARGWTSQAEQVAQENFAIGINGMLHVQRRNDIPRDGKACRGFMNICLKEPTRLIPDGSDGSSTIVGQNGG